MGGDFTQRNRVYQLKKQQRLLEQQNQADTQFKKQINDEQIQETCERLYKLNKISKGNVPDAEEYSFQPKINAQSMAICQQKPDLA